MNLHQHTILHTRYYTAKNGTSFAVRPAILADRQRIEQNIIAICAEQEYLHTDTFVYTSEWETALIRSIDMERRQVLVVAQVKETVIGHVRLFPVWFGPKGRHVANLGIAIVKPWREIGIGTSLLDYLLDWAIRMDYSKASVEVIASNQRAINLFSKFGFTKEGRRLKHIKINGAYHDEVLMGLDLKQGIHRSHVLAHPGALSEEEVAKHAIS